MDAIYGTEGNKSTSLRFQDAVNDISRLGTKQDQNLPARYRDAFMSKSAYLLTGRLLYDKSMTMSSGAETLATGAALGFASVAYPRLIDMILKNPSMGRQFHEWATAPNGSAKAILANFPRLAAWLKDNSENEKEQLPPTSSLTAGQ